MNGTTGTRTGRSQPAPGPACSLHAIGILVQLAECGVCHASGPGNPCVQRASGADGMHVSRFAAARRRNLITSEELGAVIWNRRASASSAVIWDDTFGQAAR